MTLSTSAVAASCSAPRRGRALVDKIVLLSGRLIQMKSALCDSWTYWCASLPAVRFHRVVACFPQAVHDDAQS
jgi:hypothetical protein